MIKALSSVVLDLGMNTSLLSVKRLSVESHLRRAFLRGRDDGLKRKQADRLGTSSNVKSPVAG